MAASSAGTAPLDRPAVSGAGSGVGAAAGSAAVGRPGALTGTGADPGPGLAGEPTVIHTGPAASTATHAGHGRRRRQHSPPRPPAGSGAPARWDPAGRPEPFVRPATTWRTGPSPASRAAWSSCPTW